MNKTNQKKGGGVLSGLLFLVIGIGVLWYNEGRTVKTQSAINEASKKYTDVSSEKIDEKYEGKLVATKGKINTSESTQLKDDKFGINVQAAKLTRTVEMYQWKEECETDDNDKKNCKYEKVWEDSVIDSTEFTQAGHTNPNTLPYENETYIADNVKIGAYTLPEELIRKVSNNKKKSTEELTEEYNKSIEGLNVVDNYLTNVKENTPEIGDIRISYQYLTDQTVSVLAVQTNNTFEAFTSKKGKDIYEIRTGNYTGAQILEKMTKSNNTWKWILRFIGTFVVIAAIGSMFSFLTNLTNRIPILGNIVSGATGLISAVLGIAISLIVIALAWLRYRPLLSIILIAIAVASFVFLKYYKKNSK